MFIEQHFNWIETNAKKAEKNAMAKGFAGNESFCVCVQNVTYSPHLGSFEPSIELTFLPLFTTTKTTVTTCTFVYMYISDGFY